jgi:RNA recognition motif-containing protein
LATVFVGNLAPDVTDNDLREMFAQYGKILSLRHLARRGLAFVELESPAAAAAVEGLRGQRLHDRTMDVALDESSPGGKRRGGRRR